MTLLDRFHEEHENDGALVVFRCRECGQHSLSLGSLHAHIEGHRGYTRLGIQVPFTQTSPGDFDRLMEYTDVLRVDNMSEMPLAEVEGL
jgi:hypothetical protein